MLLPKTPEIVIKYSIIPNDKGVLLCIWEPAPMDETRVRPFLYMVRQRFASEDEASTQLNHYLTIYRTGLEDP